MKAYKNLTVFFSFIPILVVASKSKGGAFGKVRHLASSELQCSTNITNNGQGQENVDQIEVRKGRLAAYSSGNLGIGLLKRIRAKDQDFYRDVVDNAIMVSCDVDEASERCVEADSSIAARDWNESCIVSSDFSCPVGTCERTSNCYWATASSGGNRTTRFEEERYAEAIPALTALKRSSYVGGLAAVGLVGVVLAVLLFMMWGLIIVARYCCCCLWTCGCCFLCSPIPKEKGYRFCFDIGFPIVFYFCCLGGILVCGILAFIGNADMDRAATLTFHHSSELMEDMSLFLERSRVPMVNIDEIVQEAAIDAKGIFDDTSYVTETATEIVASFQDFGVLHLDGIEASGSASTFDSAVAGFEDQVSPIVDDVQDMLNTLEVDLYENVDLIQSAIISAVGQVDSMINKTEEFQDKISELEKREYEFRTTRKFTVLGIFAVSFALAFAGFVGILSSKSYSCDFFFYLLHVAWVTCAILGSVAFLLAAATLTASLLWWDVCEISTIVTEDFEPFLGDKIAPGANACFDGTNLAVAFNVTDKVDFQAKLDEGLAAIENVNITEKFADVTSPLEEVQLMVESITTTALGVLNLGTSLYSPTCPFNDTYSKDNVLYPWMANAEKDTTAWVLGSTAVVGQYDRQGLENATEYMERIYDVAGRCLPVSLPSSCCLGAAEDDDADNCDVGENGWCDLGDDCRFVCSDLAAGIVAGYSAYVQANDVEQLMTADLGVVSVCPAGYTCPTDDFRGMGHDLALLDLLEAYRVNITGTSGDLVDLSSTSVGETMEEVQAFLCNMNVSFVGQRFDQVRDDFCGLMLGGFTQINWALWILAIVLEVTAFLGSLLTVRLRGYNSDDADTLDYDKLLRKSMA